MTNKQIAAAFAAGVENASNPAHSLYIQDGVIYSYGPHFVLGKHTGPDEVTITTRKYSMTTSHHTSLVAGACAVSGLRVVRAEL